ncbi:TPA: HNH endonuclease [bacterium]|mgnify:CR=1 FL=1|nr:HNH endonuclease [bacterium]
MAKTINELVMEYFKNHPLEELTHGQVVDWVTSEYLKEHDTPPRDPWREIRSLYQKGKLIQVRKGVYKYDPDYVKEVELFDFPPQIKEEIFKRDNYKCVVCGRGKEDGVEICADHKKPKDKGGKNTLENGQTLCMEHNLLKKNYSRTEAGKKYFIQLYDDAVANDDEKMIKFCKDIFDLYDKHGINGHIERPNCKK